MPVCERAGIACVKHTLCKKLCSAASLWADDGKKSTVELLLAPESVDFIVSSNIADRIDSVKTRNLAPANINILNEKHKEAVIAIFSSEDGKRSIREAAAQVGVTRNAVHVRLARAIRHLRQELDMETLMREGFSDELA